MRRVVPLLLCALIPLLPAAEAKTFRWFPRKYGASIEIEIITEEPWVDGEERFVYFEFAVLSLNESYGAKIDHVVLNRVSLFSVEGGLNVSAKPKVKLREGESWSRNWTFVVEALVPCLMGSCASNASIWLTVDYDVVDEYGLRYPVFFYVSNASVRVVSGGPGPLSISGLTLWLVAGWLAVVAVTVAVVLVMEYKARKLERLEISGAPPS